jgi:6-pyruvoyltetrahydropterin/6-carboxytetrahydropterin synthase
MNRDEFPISCTRRFQFCAGHRIMGHENKCAHLHGHNYVAYVTAAVAVDQTTTDNIGRVIDFSVLKERYGAFIDRNWDHGFILHSEDGVAAEAIERVGQALGFVQKVWYLPNANPTAENIARYLLKLGPDLMEGTGVEITKVVVWETENCSAEATR